MISSISDVLYCKTDGVYFAPGQEVKSNKINGVDAAWICDAVMERRQAARSANSIASYVPFSRVELLEGNPMHLTSAIRVAEQIQGVRGNEWFKQGCCDPNHPIYGSQEEASTRSLVDYINDYCKTGYCTSPDFDTNPYSVSSLKRDEIMSMYDNLKLSTSFIGALGLDHKASGIYPDFCRKEGPEGYTHRNNGVIYATATGHYKTSDPEINDWSWYRAITPCYFGNIRVRDVPRGAKVTLFIAADMYMSSAWWLASDPEAAIPGIKDVTPDSILKRCGICHHCFDISQKVATTSGSVVDIEWTIEEIMDRWLNVCNIAWSFLGESQVGTSPGSYRDKRYARSGSMSEAVLVPYKSASANISGVKPFVVIDLGDHSKWWS